MRALSLITYLIYCAVWDCGLIAGAGYLVFWRHESPLWILVGAVLGFCSYKPAQWRELWEPKSQ